MKKILSMQFWQFQKAVYILDNQFKQNLFNSLKEDDQYRDLIQKLEDTEHPNEISVNDQIFRIKQGTLKVHEKKPSKCSELLENGSSKRAKYQTNDPT